MVDLFRIDEIVRHIFKLVENYVYDDDVRPPLVVLRRDECTMRTLAALARTCQAFKEPALDSLWRDLPDLFVFVKYLLPEGSVTYVEPKRTLFVANDMGAHIWERITPYLRRVETVGRSLPYRQTRGRILDVETALAPLGEHLLALAQEEGEPFPNLREVTYHYTWNHPLYCKLLLSRRLRVLRLPVVLWHDLYEECRRTPGGSDNLNLLPGMQPHFSQAICRFDRLEEFWCRNYLVDEAAMRHLASLPTLSKAVFDDGWHRGGYPTSQPNERPFANLRDLTVTNSGGVEASRESVMAYIRPLRFEVMTMLWEHVYGDYSADLLGYIWRNLLEYNIQPESIAAVVDMSWSFQLEAVGGEQALAAVFDLVRFTHLRTVRIEVELVLQLSNETLRTLSESLPQLETLSLVPPKAAPFAFNLEEEIPTLDGLVPLVQRCTRLKTLRIAVRASLGLAYSVPETIMVRGRLQSIELWTTPVESQHERVEMLLKSLVGRASPSCRIVLPALEPKEHDQESERHVKGVDHQEWMSVLSNVRAHLQSAAATEGGRWSVAWGSFMHTVS